MIMNKKNRVETVEIDDLNALPEMLDGRHHVIPIVTGGDEVAEETDVPEILPILTLRSSVLFPGSITPITVGRDKSISLVRAVNAEGGMLGYALYGVLMGEQSGFAAVDLGQTVFAYTAFLGLLSLTDGQKPTAKGLLKNMVTNKCCIGMALGILLGALGVGQWVLAGPAAGLVTGVISAITAPTSALVLLVVGYELELDKSLLKPVAVTVVCRLALMAVLLAAVSFITFRIVPYDKGLQIALMILYALPAPFIIPLFADVGEEGKYISTSLSVHTLCTILLFVAIAAFSLT